MSLSHLKKLKPKDIAIRFVFGGVVCVATGWIASEYGRHVGGVFLGFPAILPASLTMISHESGRKGASQDAKGAALGSIGLAAFGVAASLLVGHVPFAVALLLATAVWLAVGTTLWRAFLYVDPSAVDRDVRDPARRPSAKRESRVGEDPGERSGGPR